MDFVVVVVVEPTSDHGDKRLEIPVEFFDSFVKNSQLGVGWHFLEICSTEVSSKFFIILGEIC